MFFYTQTHTLSQFNRRLNCDTREIYFPSFTPFLNTCCHYKFMGFSSFLSPSLSHLDHTCEGRTRKGLAENSTEYRNTGKKEADLNQKGRGNGERFQGRTGPRPPTSLCVEVRRRQLAPVVSCSCLPSSRSKLCRDV